MVNYIEKIKEFEAELSKTPYNKKTQHHIGLVKAKIAKLKERQEKRSAKKGKHEGYSVRKTGDGTVIILGYPSVGKSTLLNGITNASSPIGHYDFTTLDVIPGILEYGHAKIQVLDMPGIVKGAARGTGRGKEVLAVLRSADLILILLDVYHPEHHRIIKKEVYDATIRMNQQPPDVKLRKTGRGGIQIGTTVKLTKLNEKTIKSIFTEFRMTNVDIVIRENINDDQLIDVIEKNKVYIPAMTVVNKIDMAEEKQIKKTKAAVKPDIMISAEKKTHLDELKKLIFDKLNFIRIYLKEPGKHADMVEPLIMFKNCTIKDLCLKLHKDFVSKFRFARLWGRSARFDGQRVLKLKHKLIDKDVVEVHLK